jgi:hypothetical protein
MRAWKWKRVLRPQESDERGTQDSSRLSRLIRVIRVIRGRGFVGNSRRFVVEIALKKTFKKVKKKLASPCCLPLNGESTRQIRPKGRSKKP